MSKEGIRTLILPAGSRIAIGAIKFLKKEKKFKVISADIDKLAPGLYLSDKGYLTPPFSQKNFWPEIKRLIKKEKIDIIIPALDPLLVEFAKNFDFFNQLGVRVIISPPETIFLTRDKWKTYELLKDEIPVAKSFITKNKINIPFPLIIKPRDGSGSQNVFKVESKRELDFYWRKIKNPIVQEYLEGKEYTVDCLSDLDGKLLACVPRIRIETKAGVSIKGKVVKDDRIEKIAKKITEKIKFQGPFFFQLKEKKGNLKLTEINARFGGGMPLTAKAGLNIYSLSVRLFLGEKIKISKIKWGTYFTRYDEEIFLTEREINSKIQKI